eukprot:TRINITY_DN1327_c1_g2_i2.p1 TRINITY_DN1327_c1_g2~~TRINITY_DN1327_c1_g2_i2.p1  ORF type:complete len:625 (+),score=114.18 TRINITY_DN1327_c1_g2_i2:63-1937(+)
MDSFCLYYYYRRMQTQERRLKVLNSHLQSSDSCKEKKAQAPSCNALALYQYLTHDNYGLREAIYQFLKDPIYKPDYYLDIPQQRELTLQRLKKFASQRFFSVRDYVQDPRRFIAGMECLALVDYSLCIKAGVHYSLCGGTIARLGTKKHDEKYLDGIDSVSLAGCFGMTELAHGSNVMGIETTAHYDEKSQQFVINTPDDTASKFWIGGAAQHAHICTVFAQLYVKGVWQGPHVFVVRLRDAAGNICPGIRIDDNGPKMGMNGVDNGRIWFNNVRIPLDDMLDKFASVSPSGEYTSSIPKVAQRFPTMMGSLTAGRMLICQGACDNLKIALKIAIFYGSDRPQFGDVPILSYLTHQRRLFTGLSTAFALHIANGEVKNKLTSGTNNKEVHILSSGLKAAASWNRVLFMQHCRECCGGLGVLSQNKIGPMLADMNVDVTFEGDNTVLMQQVAKYLLDLPPNKAHLSPQISMANFSQKDILSLLRFRQNKMVADIQSEIKSTGKTEGYNSNLDKIVELGWAYVDLFSFETFLEKVESAPQSVKDSLDLVCELYGLLRVEAAAAFYLGEGLLLKGDLNFVRNRIHQIFGLMWQNNAELAKKLCDGFGLPDHLVQAPIAFNWRTIQTA